MNIYIYNINGNKSNFNTLAPKLNCFRKKMSIIGITETNVDSYHKDLYPLDGFKSYYSDKLPNKLISSGVALHIHESFNALTYEEVTTSSLHLETLFLKTIKGNRRINAGVV